MKSRNKKVRVLAVIALSSIFLLMITPAIGAAQVDKVALNEIQQAIEAKGANWTAGETSVSKLSVAEQKMLCGAEIGPIPGDAVVLSPPELSAVPATFDWRNKDGQNWVTPVEDQGQCGSCWIFGAAAAFETQINIDANDPTIDFDASEQYILSCLSGGWGCGGGDPASTLTYIRDHGVPDDACLPYQANDGISCSTACSDWQDRAWTCANYGTATTHTTAAYKTYLQTYGPMVVVLEVPNDFLYYTGGLYEPVWTTEEFGWANHCVMLVGYDDTYNGGSGCWIVKNSWGTNWGENGYARVAYGDLEQYQYAFWVLDTSGPEPEPEPQEIVVLDDTVENTGWSEAYWDETGLWHVTERRANSPTHSWWYGKESTGNYDTGSANSGCLVSQELVKRFQNNTATFI